MSLKITETSNYGLFELLQYNRDVKKIKGLTDSMSRYGWISAYPMNVHRNGNGKLTIKDGHHRFEVASRLGLPIKYIICDDNSSIYELDKATNKWTLGDYLESYCRGGKAEYVKAKEYCQRTGIAPIYAIAMLSGHTAGTQNYEESFKTGRFACKNTRNAEIVADIVLHCKKKGIDWADKGLLVVALSKVAWVRGFSISRLKSKITTFSYLVEKKPHVDGYLDMIESVYNYKAQDKVPLKFLANEAAKERNIIKKTSKRAA